MTEEALKLRTSHNRATAGLGAARCGEEESGSGPWGLLTVVTGAERAVHGCLYPGEDEVWESSGGKCLGLCSAL